jgi:hypothetical protein
LEDRAARGSEDDTGERFLLRLLFVVSATHWRDYGKSNSALSSALLSLPMVNSEASCRSLKQPVEFGTLAQPH